MLSNELLSELHGQVSLNAVHRFMSHNPEWVGQTIGAGLGPESEEGAGGAGAAHNILPWGYSVYRRVTRGMLVMLSHVTLHRQTASHDMITNCGGVNVNNAMTYSIDWEAAFR